jgi:hypothetical protein
MITRAPPARGGYPHSHQAERFSPGRNIGPKESDTIISMNARRSYQHLDLLPVRAAGKRLHYAPDYVAKLCREGKLECSAIGGAWYVQKKSVAAFRTARTYEEAVRAHASAQVRRNPPKQAAARPGSAVLPVTILFASILACMALSVFVLTLHIR